MTFQKSALATACALAGMMIVSTPAMAIGGASGPHVGYPTTGKIGAVNPENRGIYTQSDSSKKSSRNIWSLAVVSVDQRY